MLSPICYYNFVY